MTRNLRFTIYDLRLLLVALVLTSGLAARAQGPYPVVTPFMRDLLRCTNASELAAKLTTLQVSSLVGAQVVTNGYTGPLTLTNGVPWLNKLTAAIYDNQGHVIFDPVFGGGSMFDRQGEYSISINSRQLWRGTFPGNAAVVDWDNGLLIDSNNVTSYDWYNRQFYGLHNFDTVPTVNGQTVLTNTYYPSNTFSLFSITNTMANFSHTICDSNGVLVSVKYSNSAVFFQTIQN